MRSDIFILLINAVSRILTLTNILSQSPASFSRHTRKFPQDWLYPFDFSAFIQSEVSPRQSQNLQKNWSKGWTLSTTFPISTSFYNFQFCCWNDCRFR